MKSAAKENLADLEKKFRPDLQAFLDEKLTVVNRRDDDAINEKLEAIKDALKDELETTVDLRFGGSVAKNTYVDGISDVDDLLVLRGDNSETPLPSDLMKTSAERLQEAFPGATIATGKVAITINDGGVEIQLIPALKSGNGFRVPAWDADCWSKINPKTFADALTARNQECKGKLVPTIKLAKAINAHLPTSQQLSGYHIESMAIAAFRNYDGLHTTACMLPKLFEEMSTRVLTPVRDRTGQSVNVDSELGKSRGIERVKRGHVLERLAKRMRVASAGQSINGKSCSGTIHRSLSMIAQLSHLDELQRMQRVTDQSITAHSILRDRYSNRALWVDILMLVASATVAVGTFAGDDILQMLMGGHDHPRVILGLVSVGVFVLSLIQFKVGWKERASAHAEAARALSQTKAEIRDVRASTNWISASQFKLLAVRYSTTHGNVVGIPESCFVPLKARHKRKVRISKTLDRFPHACLPWLWLWFWYQDTVRSTCADDV